MSIPGFLIPIVALEVIAVLAVLCGLWLLFTDKLEADERDRITEPGGHTTATDKVPEHAGVSSSVNPAPAAATRADADDSPSPPPAAAKSAPPEQADTTPSADASDET